jgi:RND superfamily putative drug exporter
VLVAALTRWVLRHKTLVVIVWLGLTAAGAASAPRAIEAMSSDFESLPGRPGYEANQEIRRVYGTGGDANPLVLVVQLPVGASYSVASCDLRILMDQPTESISPDDGPSRQDDSGFARPKWWHLS